jgi:hypothetical protein
MACAVAEMAPQITTLIAWRCNKSTLADKEMLFMEICRRSLSGLTIRTVAATSNNGDTSPFQKVIAIVSIKKKQCNLRAEKDNPDNQPANGISA